METDAVFTNLENSDPSQPCSVVALNGHTMQLKVPQPVGIGSPVKIESDDTISLGEVSQCLRGEEGYIVWVNLVEALHNVEELSRLARALLA